MSVASAAALNLSGRWAGVYHCEVGWCAGQDFPGTSVLYQAEGSNIVTSSNGAETVTGVLTGNTLVSRNELGSYWSEGVATVSADGLTMTGTGHDSNGTSGSTESRRQAGSVSGVVLQSDSKPAPGITVKVIGKSDEGTTVSESAATDVAGKYAIALPPGEYEVSASGDPHNPSGTVNSATHEANGGVLAVTKTVPAQSGVVSSQPPAASTAQCSGTVVEAVCKLSHLAVGDSATANFTYTWCASKERKTNGKPPTDCPIIFIPGFLGSKIACSSGELWPNVPAPDFADMLLEPDGSTNAPGACNSTAHTIPGQEGIVSTAGVDVYGSALAYLNRIAPGRAFGFTYDWRKSPLLAVKALDEEVDEVLKSTGASRVVLMGHSMGGLVTQAYLEDRGHAEKVIRAITLGTPYWGAPKSHVALMTGHSGEVPFEVGLDILVKGPDLQLAARNMEGLYWLYPSTNFGPWLTVVGGGYPRGQLAAPELDRWVASLGGTSALLDEARAGHAKLDGFKTNGVDYQIVVGTGVPTITSMEVEDNPFEETQLVKSTFGSGDGTVPARSGSQGAFETGATAGEHIPFHYVCGIGHVGLPGDPGVQNRIEGFLLEGVALKGTENNCAIAGAETQIYHVHIPNHGHAVRPGATAPVATADGALTLQQANSQGLIQLYETGGKSIVVTDARHPVTLKLSGKGLAVRVRSLSGKGSPRYFGPANGSLTIAPSGAVKRNGKALKAGRADRAPHTKARISRRGRKYVLHLSAKGSSGVAAIYVRIGSAASRVYRKPLVLTAKQLRTLHFAAVDKFGKWEHQHRASVPH